MEKSFWVIFRSFWGYFRSFWAISGNFRSILTQKRHSNPFSRLFQKTTCYAASSKSLVDRTLATALAMHGAPKTAEFKSFKNKVDLAKSLVKSSDMYDWSRFENDAGVNAVALAVDTIVAVARLTQEKLQELLKKMVKSENFVKNLVFDPENVNNSAFRHNHVKKSVFRPINVKIACFR